MSERLRVPEDGLREGATELSEESSRYVAKVHRKKEGDELLLFDPVQGLQGAAVITSAKLPRIGIELSPLEKAPTSNMPVVLVQGIGKGDKPEQAIRDATVFGAERVILLSTQRSVARSDGGARRERLLRVASQVARQCERGDLPALEGPVGFEELLQELSTDGTHLLCCWHPDGVPLIEAAQNVDWANSRVTLWIGPEGGFSPTEVEQAVDWGMRPVSLGPYVLRSETATGAALSVLRAVSAG